MPVEELATTIPPTSEAQQRRLRALGEALLAATPQQRQDAINIAGKLLAIKARKRALRVAEPSVTRDAVGRPFAEKC